MGTSARPGRAGRGAPTIQDPHPDPVTAARLAAVRAGFDPTPDLDAIATAERDPDPRIRVAALGARVRGGMDARAAWRRACTDPDPGVRRRAAELAPRVPGADADALIALATDADPSVAEAAAWALGERATGDDAPIDATLEHLARDHADALVREAAVAALGARGTGLATILHACGDRPAVRRRAVLALAPFEGPEVTAALTRALEDRDWQVRQAAEDLLGVDAGVEAGGPDDGGTTPG
jgi:HEAT repeat protein